MYVITSQWKNLSLTNYVSDTIPIAIYWKTNKNLRINQEIRKEMIKFFKEKIITSYQIKSLI